MGCALNKVRKRSPYERRFELEKQNIPKPAEFKFNKEKSKKRSIFTKKNNFENKSSPEIKKNADQIKEFESCVIGCDYKPPPGGRCGRASMETRGIADDIKITSSDTIEKRDKINLKGGAHYTGQWKGLNKEGFGVLVFNDGNCYAGQFKDNKACGNGKWNGPDGSSYEGQWKNDKINGEGKFIHSDGSTYVGEWVNDLKHGKGIETWGNGTIYEGSFVEGNKCGKGKIIFPDGSSYEGQFKDDVFQGQGTYKWKNGCVYTGEWKNSLMHGNGTYTWPTGRFAKYEGKYKEGLKEGKGKLFYRDGIIYDGPFVKNKQHGIGVQVWLRGEETRGEWQNGMFVKWIDQLKNTHLGVAEDHEDEQDYSTVAYSNPERYHKLYQQEKKKLVKLDRGILPPKKKIKFNKKTTTKIFKLNLFKFSFKILFQTNFLLGD